jgi:hypothetical protein
LLGDVPDGVAALVAVQMRVGQLPDAHTVENDQDRSSEDHRGEITQKWRSADYADCTDFFFS